MSFINEPLSAFIMKYFEWLWSVLWEFISVVIMFYDVLLFIYLWLLVLKVFVLLNDVYPCFLFASRSFLKVQMD